MVLVLAVPELLVLIAALGAMMVAFVFRKTIGDFLVSIFSGIPVIGDQVVKAVQWAMEQADKGARVVVDAAVQPITDFVDGVVGSAMAVVGWVTAAATWLGVTLKITIANLWNHIEAISVQLSQAFSNGLLALQRVAAQALALAQLGARVAWLTATAIPSAIAQAVGQAVARAQALVAAAKSIALAAVNAALATALRAVGNEQAARAAADTAVKAYAAATAILVGHKAAQDLAGLEAWTGQQVGQIGQAIDGITAKIGPLAYPTVAAAITAITATITTLERGCINPTCNYLAPQLQALELAMDVTMLLAVAEMVASAANDPRGAAGETVATASPLLGMVSGMFADLTGQGVRV